MAEHIKNMYVVIENLQGEAYIVTIPYNIFNDESKYKLSDSCDDGESVGYFSEEREKCERYIDDNGYKRIPIYKTYRTPLQQYIANLLLGSYRFPNMKQKITQFIYLDIYKGGI